MVRLSEAELAWLEQAYREHHRAVFSTCLQFAAGDRAWALDRMQDVFVTLARDRGSLTDPARPGGWLRRAAINTCLMALRRGRVWSKLQGVLTFGHVDPGHQAERALRAKRDLTRLERALGTLPAKQRAVVVLVELEEVSQKEAAVLLGLSKGQISKLHARALEALRRYDWDVDHG